jgi:hypothetical protein
MLLAVVLLAGGAWYFRGAIPGPWSRTPVPAGISEEAAVSADDKLERMREHGAVVRLSGVEFTSWLRYRMASRVALDLEAPLVSFDGETVRVDGRLPKERIPRREVPRGLGRFLPDTVDVSVSGGLRTIAPGRAALRIERASFAGMPLGRETYLPLLDRVDTGDPGLREDELAFQLPPGVGAARVEDGELVLSPPGGGR